MKLAFGKLKRFFAKSKQVDSFDVFIFDHIGRYPKDKSLYMSAFTHKSLSAEPKENFQRLEFLGDSILGAVITHWLFEQRPNYSEGKLTILKAKLASRKHLNTLGKQFALTDFIRSTTQAQLSNSILGDVLEAFIGAIYLDFGWAFTKQFLHNKVLQPIDLSQLETQVISYKNELLEAVDKNKWNAAFVLIEEHDDGAQKEYEMGFSKNGIILKKTRSYSKKIAIEQLSEQVLKSGILQSETNT
ncbi:MAG: ribonuclease III family protein [Flavobacteriales bacterium]